MCRMERRKALRSWKRAFLSDSDYSLMSYAETCTSLCMQYVCAVVRNMRKLIMTIAGDAIGGQNWSAPLFDILRRIAALQSYISVVRNLSLSCHQGRTINQSMFELNLAQRSACKLRKLFQKSHQAHAKLEA